MPDSVDDNTAKSTRRTEIATAFALMVAMAVLLVAVDRFAQPAPVPEVVDYSQDPIIVFPDFASIPRVDVKKQQFFDYLQSFVEAENARILELREEVAGFASVLNAGDSLSRRELARMLQLATMYEIDTETSSNRRIVNTLLNRVDIIPISLVLAQAANESAWGTSRFTLEGYNIFGQWCYEEGCGIVPERRTRGATHEVKRFDSISGSVAAYFLNINTHHLYQEFRETRARMRRMQQALDPLELAYGLGRYSERGDHYVDEVQTIIEQNQLQRRDNS